MESTLESTLILTIFALVFYLIFTGREDRNLVIIYGASATVLTGMMMGFYSPIAIVQSVNFETLFLLFGMMLYSKIMADTGVFQSWAIKIARFSNNDPWLTLTSFALITFILSLFINNFTTIVIIVPITVLLCINLGMRPIPVVITEVIASNLGGASSMVGDFPNMLISSSTPYDFFDFLMYMLPICLLGLATLLLYLFVRGESLLIDKKIGVLGGGKIPKMNEFKAALQCDPYKIYIGYMIFFLMVVMFILATTVKIPPSTTAIVGSILALIFVSSDRKKVVTEFNYRDIIFFFCLFVMVGAIEATGALTMLSYYIWVASNGSEFMQGVYTLVSAGFLTIILNAGPTTALYLPVVGELYNYGQHEFIFWALSLGVCAGSSAAITGATAGLVASNYLSDYAKENDIHGTKDYVYFDLTFRKFMNIGIPFMGIFMVLSSVYLWVRFCT